MSIRTRFARGCTPRTALIALMLASAAGTAGAMRAMVAGWVAGGATRSHSVWVGLYDNRLVVRGTPGRDIDCWVYDADGDLVDSDTDATSTCILETPGVGTHRLVIRNYASLGSSYTAWQEE